jgi:predicted lipid-binding transport protein (Tim44 family)
MSLQLIQLLIFAALAAVVLYQLYAVLGRKVGRQPEDNAEAALPAAKDSGSRAEAAEGVALSGLAALKARDPGFDVPHFLDGARSAYEMVVKAFAAGDRETLGLLLSPRVMAGFESAMAAREAEGRTEEVEFLQAPRADVEGADVIGDQAQIRVRFLAEFRSRSQGPEGGAVDDRRTAEIWTFERPLTSRDPNWTLVRVDPAEA